MFTATVYPTKETPNSKSFEQVGRAKSFAGWAFNQADVQAVEVIDESGKVYLNLDKNNPDGRISIR